jgi:hypothetical protein
VRYCGKKTVERDWPQMTVWRMRIACWITNATITRSQYLIFNCFPTATVVTRTRLNITFIRTLPVLFNFFITVVPNTVLYRVSNLDS